MKAQIIAIGDEILLGQTLDTNSHYIAQNLTQIPISVSHIQCIADEQKAIEQALSQSFADLIICTGGLGPTKDDITKKTLAHYFDSPLFLNEFALDNIKNLLIRLGKAELNELNRQQALIPEIATLLPNKVGTASGMWIEKNNKIFIFLPGIPYEMKYLIKNEVLPRLKKLYPPQNEFRKNILVFQIPESELALKLEDWENALPTAMSLAYLPNAGIVKMRLTYKASSKKEAEEELQHQINKLKAILGSKVISDSGESLVEMIGTMLKTKNWSLSTAESFTSGRIITALTSISGSSQYIKGALVPYQITIKESILHVDSNLIDKHQIVSSQMAEEMARKAQKLFDSDIALATTGVAGPTTDAQHPEVGRAFVGVYIHSQIFSKEFYFPDLERNDFADWVSKKALEFLFTLLQKT